MSPPESNPALAGRAFADLIARFDERTLRLLSVLTGHQVGDAFFEALVTRLSGELEVRYAVIAALSDQNPRRFTAVAAAADGELVDPASLDLGSAPWHQ